MDKKMSTLMNTSDCNKENAKCIDASDIKGKILPSCRTQEERWQEAFLNLADKDPNSKHKTILNGIVKDIIKESNKEKAKQISEQEFGKTIRLSAWEGDIDIYAQYFSKIKDISQFDLSHKAFCVLLNRARGTIINWHNGKGLPKYRDDVIKLAFWAKYTVEETNKLLACAGKHSLYVKGSENKNTLVDTVYIHMLNHRNYSFAKAQKLIKETNQVIQQKIQAQNKEGVIVLSHDPSSDSKNMEKLLLNKVGNSDADFLTFIKQHVDSFIYNYQKLYDILCSDFETQYDVNNKNVVNHRDSYTSSLNSLLGISAGPKRRWKNSLVKIIYAALPQKTKQTQLVDTDYHTIVSFDSSLTFIGRQHGMITSMHDCLYYIGLPNLAPTFFNNQKMKRGTFPLEAEHDLTNIFTIKETKYPQAFLFASDHSDWNLCRLRKNDVKIGNLTGNNDIVLDDNLKEIAVLQFIGGQYYLIISESAQSDFFQINDDNTIENIHENLCLDKEKTYRFTYKEKYMFIVGGPVILYGKI